MDRTLARTIVVVALIALLSAGLLPLPTPVSAQTELQCTESVPNPSAPSRGHHDLIVTNVTPYLQDGTEKDAGRWSGKHWLGEGQGDLNVTFTIKNQGALTTAPTTPVRVNIDLKRPDGTGTQQNVDLPTPASGATANGYALFAITNGRYSVNPHVNPSRSVDESCTDAAPTATPGTGCVRQGTQQQICRYEYYANNDDLIQPIVVGTFPDLVVSKIETVGPVRATKTVNADSQAAVKVTITNQGNDVATSKKAATPGAVPFQVKIGATGGKCTGGTADGDATLVNIDQIAVGASKTVQATCQLHGLRSTFNVTATADPKDDVTESIETNQESEETFTLPTPDLAFAYTTGLALNSKGEHVIAKGRPLIVNGTVSNGGDAPAKTTAGGPFSVKMKVKTASSTSDFYPPTGSPGTFTLGAFESVLVDGTVGAATLTDTAVPYTILLQADPDDAVLEANETNEKTFLVRVAAYKVNLTASPPSAAVAPGTVGKIEVRVKNDGNTDDIVRLSANVTGVRFQDDDGDTVETITLQPGKTAKVAVLYDIPKSGTKGERFPVWVTGKSASQGADASDDIRLLYTVGDDDVKPTITLVTPDETVRDGKSYAYVATNNITFKVTDNIAVAKVQVDIADRTETLEPMTGTTDTYRVDITGLTDPTLTIRATDTNNNQATKELQVVRDADKPRFSNWAWLPVTGATPGTKVRYQVGVTDDNLDQVTVRITQARQYRPTSSPGISTCEPIADVFYDRTFTLRSQGANYVVDEWIVPERPGRYLWTVTATDRAGNAATIIEGRDEFGGPQKIRYQCLSYFSEGMNIVVVEALPLLSTREPDEGDTVRMTFNLRNTNARFGTGRFEVVFVEDEKTAIGRTIIELAPSETRPITMDWKAKPGFHNLALVIDRTDAVPESDEDDNLFRLSTDVLFPGQDLFAEGSTAGGVDGFLDRVGASWYVPLLLAANAVLFVVAVALGRRAGVIR